jgi:hypothetical protein
VLRVEAAWGTEAASSHCVRQYPSFNETVPRNSPLQIQRFKKSQNSNLLLKRHFHGIVIVQNFRKKCQLQPAVCSVLALKRQSPETISEIRAQFKGICTF